MDEEGLVSLSFAKGPLGFTLSKSTGRTINSILPPGHSLNANAAATEKLEVGWVLERVGGKRVVRDKALIAAQIKSAQRPVLLTWRAVRGDSPRSGGSAAASAAPRAEQQSDTEDSDEDELWGTKTAPPLDSPHKVAEEGVPPRPEGHEPEPEPKPEPEPEPEPEPPQSTEALRAEVVGLVGRLQSHQYAYMHRPSLSSSVSAELRCSY